MSGSMISAPERHPVLTLSLVLLLAALLAGCGAKQVVVEGNFPTPLMNKIPLTIGIWYDQDFSTHEFFDEAKGRSESSWIVKTGDAQIQMWDTLLGGMFTRVVHLDRPPGPGQMTEVVDAILVPHVDELQYAIPAHTSVKVYEIWMRYRFQLVTNGGQDIADWTMSAYGKTPTAFLQSDEAAVNLAAVVALRDAGANFATNFTRVPAINDWLVTRNSPAASVAQP